jgi:hypothetical protein
MSAVVQAPPDLERQVIAAAQKYTKAVQALNRAVMARDEAERALHDAAMACFTPPQPF